MPIVATLYRPIPDRLYHFTGGTAAFNIISGGRGKDKEICFWLKNAKSKNDAAELRLGVALLDGLQQYMRRNNRPSVINDVNINPDLVYMNSFTEGDIVTEHMLEYGHFRLEFDLGTCRYKNDIRVLHIFGKKI